ncbi:MAG: hypothetical protein HZC24_11845 [Rhodocyclales bacterium]|nr:hypothetical protein [Rhodocyclales bacterium]
MSIRIYRDAAVVAYHFDKSFAKDCQRVDMGGRDMSFFIKEEGGGGRPVFGVFGVSAGRR